MRNANEMKENGWKRYGISGLPQNLKTVLHDNETVKRVVELTTKHGRTFQKVLHINTNPITRKGNFEGRHECYWAAKPVESNGNPSFRHNFRTGTLIPCRVTGKLATLFVQSRKMVHGEWRWNHEYMGVTNGDGEGITLVGYKKVSKRPKGRKP